MSQRERHGTRDQIYSAWHRSSSLARFVGIEKAQTLALIDIDATPYVEYDDDDKQPLILIETARDIGQSYKNATVTRLLAERCAPVLPAYTLLYLPATTVNPADPSQLDISRLRVKRLHPDPQTIWQEYSPQQWAERLIQIRTQAAKRIDEYYTGLRFG